MMLCSTRKRVCLSGGIVLAGILLSFCTQNGYAQTRATDSLALIELYQNTGGENWKNNTGWLTTRPVGQWFGVTTQDRGGEQVVTWVQLFSNNLTGTVPSLALPDLQALLIEDNEIADIADLSALGALKFVQFEDNRLTFEDLEPNIAAINYEVFAYSPQKTTPEVTREAAGNGTRLSVDVGGTANVYTWRRDGMVIPDATGSTYTATIEGGYQCCVTNTIVCSQIKVKEGC